ncbi:hypothetical protein AGR2A_pa20006 [Agrobacterium genomosp. 2 str. CFBP 5494]|uniref:Uncharacterized protein n=1 Tax=Agrobacterium genomosp. 2 str. CFBP 5494 TaxID=1183436 RepID=A0A9W5B6F6_9HYPH|nr:hypothetical protein AGR2A_pa20006 [Agrobacterium genomosp. 2 str. CFBP 5494]
MCSVIVISIRMNQFGSPDLTLDFHSFANRNQTTLARRHAVDLHKTLETDTHHAIWGARNASNNTGPKLADTSRKQCGGNADTLRNVDRLTVETDGDRSL